jgi:phage virion morphogenesis protein
MAGVTATVEVDAQPIADLWRQLADAARARPALVDFGEYLLGSHESRFQIGVSPEGDPWAPLNNAYRARKLKKKGHDRILIYDGFLKDTLTYDATDAELRFGSNRIYAATHQFGDPARHIPARPFLGFSAADLAELEDILAEHVARLVGGE